MTDQPPAEYDLVIPFVACQSQGGPHEDDAFVAGYQAGRIDHALAVLVTVGGREMRATVRSDLVRQLDLIAMHHGFTVESEACAEGWTFATFRTAEQPAAEQTP